MINWGNLETWLCGFIWFSPVFYWVWVILLNRYLPPTLWLLYLRVESKIWWWGVCRRLKN